MKDVLEPTGALPEEARHATRPQPVRLPPLVTTVRVPEGWSSARVMPPLSPAVVLSLQRSAGNAKVARFVKQWAGARRGGAGTWLLRLTTSDLPPVEDPDVRQRVQQPRRKPAPGAQAPPASGAGRQAAPPPGAGGADGRLKEAVPRLGTRAATAVGAGLTATGTGAASAPPAHTGPGGGGHGPSAGEEASGAVEPAVAEDRQAAAADAADDGGTPGGEAPPPPEPPDGPQDPGAPGVDAEAELEKPPPRVEAPRADQVGGQPPAEKIKAEGGAAVQALVQKSARRPAAPGGPAGTGRGGAAAPRGPAGAPKPAAPAEPAAGTAAQAAMTRRDTVAGAARNAATQLDGVGQGASELGGASVAFGPAAEADGMAGDGEQQRAVAAQKVTEFLTAVALRAQQITQMGAAVPERMQAAAGAAVQSIAGGVQQRTAEVTAQVAQLRDQAAADAQAARDLVSTQHDATVQALTLETAAARRQLDQELQSALTALDAREQAQLRVIDERYRQADERFRATGRTVGGEAEARGNEMAAEYMQGLRNVDDSFLDGPLTYKRGVARADTARGISQAYRDELVKEANSQADQAQPGKARDIETARTTARQTREALQAQHRATLETLTEAETTAIQQAGEARTSLFEGIDQALQGGEEALGQQEVSLIENLRAAARTQAAAVEESAHRLTAAMQAQIAESVAGLVEVGGKVAGQVRGHPAPPVEAITAALAGASAQLDAGVAQVQGQLEQGQGTAQQQLDQAAQTIVTRLASSTQQGLAGTTATGTQVSDSLSTMARSASKSFDGIRESHTKTLTTTTTAAAEGFTRAIEGAQRAYTEMSDGLERGFAESARGLETGLRDVLPAMEREIRTKAEENAARVPPRWKNIVRWALIIAVIVVVALVAGPFVIGAVGAALGTGAVMTGIIAGAIVGAATGATIQVINNWAESRPLLEGVAKAAVIGAIGGAVGGGFGAWVGQLGQQGVAIANTSFRQFALNAVAEIVTDTGISLVTGELSWQNFGMSMLMSVVVGGGMQAASGTRAATGIQGRATGAGESFGGSVRTGVGGGPVTIRYRPGDPVTTGPRPQTDETPGGGGARPQTDETPGGGGARPQTDETPGGGGTRPQTEEGAPAGARPGGIEAETPVRVGQSEHEVKLRTTRDGAEVWVCSKVCGPMKAKIDDILPRVDEGAKAQLKALRAEAADLEARIGRGELPEAADRLRAVQELGNRLREIGKVDPKVGSLLDAEPDWSRVGAPVGEPQVIRPDQVSTLKIPEGSKVLYVVRNKKPREILKVGETTAGEPLEVRFDRYQRAATRLDMEIEIEVRTVTLDEGQGVRGPEQALRDQVDWGASGRLPWDNTVLEDLGPRLGRAGPGTPFEPLPGGSPLRKAGWVWNEQGQLVPPGTGPPPSWRRANAPPQKEIVLEQIRAAQGNVEEAAQAAGVTEETFYRWLKRYNLRARDFR